MWYNIDIGKLAVLHLPTFWRTEEMIAWVQTLASPLVDVQDVFIKNRKQNIYIMEHNGQVCYLRAALNDKFDRSQRRIKIANGNRYKRQYIYTRAEDKSKYLGTMYLYERADYGDTGVDFIVLVPTGLPYNDYEMKALIDLYRLGSKRYKIQSY